MTTSIRVDHWRNRHAYPMAEWVYIGRANTRAGQPHDSPWANPYVIGRDGDRAEVLEKYRVYITDHEWMMKRLPQLNGRVLLCWCKPSACHGDVLKELAASAGVGTNALGVLPENAVAQPDAQSQSPSRDALP